jgi:hypothetical protein
VKHLQLITQQYTNTVANMHRMLAYTAILALPFGPTTVLAMGETVPKLSNPFGFGNQLLHGEYGVTNVTLALSTESGVAFGLAARQATRRTGYRKFCLPILTSYHAILFLSTENGLAFRKTNVPVLQMHVPTAAVVLLTDNCVANGCYNGAQEQCRSSH